MKPISKIFGVYLLIILFILLVNTSFGQIKVVQYNADWNKDNTVSWISDLTDVKTKSYVNIGKDVEAQNQIIKDAIFDPNVTTKTVRKNPVDNIIKNMYFKCKSSRFNCR